MPASRSIDAVFDTQFLESASEKAVSFLALIAAFSKGIDTGQRNISGDGEVEDQSLTFTVFGDEADATLMASSGFDTDFFPCR
ncbi:MAG: hypothetical protein ACLRXQ_12195 [Phascolarctobacterium faecium]